MSAWDVSWPSRCASPAESTGAVYVSDFQRGQFTPAEIRLVSLFADQAAVAIENTRLLDSERQRSADLARSRALMESLSRLAANLEQSTDPDQLLETLRGELQQLGIHSWLGLIDAASGRAAQPIPFHELSGPLGGRGFVAPGNRPGGHPG